MWLGGIGNARAAAEAKLAHRRAAAISAKEENKLRLVAKILSRQLITIWHQY
jgi:hypothetical protein